MFNLKDIANSACGSLNPHLEVQEPKKSKYSNKKTEVDGITFDSLKEANRYRELKILLKAGEIGFLELQKEFELNEKGSHSVKYIADFAYVDQRTGETIIEDCKGFRTAVYKKKRRLMFQVFGIKIKET